MLKIVYLDASWKQLLQLFKFPLHNRSGESNSRWHTLTNKPCDGSVHNFYLKIDLALVKDRENNLIDTTPIMVRLSSQIEQVSTINNQHKRSIVKLLVQPVTSDFVQQPTHKLSFKEIEGEFAKVGINAEPLTEKNTFCQLAVMTATDFQAGEIFKQNAKATMKTTTYNDGMMSRSRHSRFIIWDSKNQEFHEFKGVHIKGVAVVTNSRYTKNGKWSNTDYTIALPDHCVGIRINQDFEQGTYLASNSWAEEYTKFTERSEFEGVEIPTVEQFVSFFSELLPNEAARIDEAADLLKELE